MRMAMRRSHCVHVSMCVCYCFRECVLHCVLSMRECVCESHLITHMLTVKLCCHRLSILSSFFALRSLVFFHFLSSTSPNQHFRLNSIGVDEEIFSMVFELIYGGTSLALHASEPTQQIKNCWK